MAVRTLGSAGLDIVEGRRDGVYVFDVTGKRFIDCITGAGSFNIGRRNGAIADVLKRAVEELDLGSFILLQEERAALAERLARITPGKLQYSFFCTGGGEANDTAIKLARGFTMRKEVVSAVNAYHGHTGFALSVTGRDYYKSPFEPLIPAVTHVPFGDLEAMEGAVTEHTAAVILEPIQGEGGIIVPPDGYLPGVRRLCDEHGALLILDEIQTGWGRTGRMFCCEHYRVEPDIMTLAKSMGGGMYPLAVTVFSEEVSDFFLPHPFIHLSTFGGNALACKVGLAVIDYLVEHNIPEHAAEMGEYMTGGFVDLMHKFPRLIREVRGRGLMIGLEYPDDSLGPRMNYELAKHGVLTLYSGNNPKVVRVMPPLIIDREEADLVLEAFDLSLQGIA
jgi:putrescine aminotransferase